MIPLLFLPLLLLIHLSYCQSPIFFFISLFICHHLFVLRFVFHLGAVVLSPLGNIGVFLLIVYYCVSWYRVVYLCEYLCVRVCTEEAERWVIFF